MGRALKKLFVKEKGVSFPVVRNTFPDRKRAFLSARNTFPGKKRAFSPYETHFLAGKELFSPYETHFPAGKELFSPYETHFLAGKELFFAALSSFPGCKTGAALSGGFLFCAAGKRQNNVFPFSYDKKDLNKFSRLKTFLLGGL